MYVVTEPRSPHDAIARLVPDDATYDVHRLLDAMRNLPQFGDPRMPGFTGDNPREVRFGKHAMWTYQDAREIVLHAFGPDGDDSLRKAVGLYRIDAVDMEDTVFIMRIGFLLRGGWNFQMAMDWILAKNNVDLSLDIAGGWMGAWDATSLTACLRAGMDEDALHAVLNSGALPDPAAIATLAALRTDVHPAADL